MRTEPVIKKEPLDIALELAGGIAAAIMIILPAYFWADIPEIVPTHFNMAGTADDFGSKWTLVILPAIGVLMFGAALIWVNRFPHKFNYPQEITEDNAQSQYQMTSRLIRIIAFVVAISFAYMTYTIIATSIGSMEGPGNYFVAIFILSTLVVPGSYLLLSRKA